MKLRFLTAAAALALAAACSSMKDGNGSDAAAGTATTSPSSPPAASIDAGSGMGPGMGAGPATGGSIAGDASGGMMGGGMMGSGSATASTPAAGGADIVAVAQGVGQFSTLVSAIQTAELVETLKGPGPYTVFAPTDAAFKAMPQGLLTQLMTPEDKGRLVSVLSYHVVPGKLASTDLRAGQSLTTVQGGKLTLTGSGSTLKVNGANIVSADVPASNGIVHAIDKVLVPAAKPS